MRLDAQAAHRVARLARLRLDDDEAERIAAQLSTVVQHAEALPVSAAPSGDGRRVMPLREDLPRSSPPGDPVEAVVHRDGRHVIVPVVLEKKG